MLLRSMVLSSIGALAWKDDKSGEFGYRRKRALFKIKETVDEVSEGNIL